MITRFCNTITCLKSKQKLYIASFGIPFLTMLALFAINGIFPFGDRSFLNIDMYHQYFPFLTEFFHKLRSGESLFYSWNAGIGSNLTALYAYYLASPVNWLCVLVPEAFLMEFMTYLVVVKIGLCGLTAAMYLSKHFKTEKLSVAFFALFYAMSGYMAAYNWNVMWLDCIVLAPLILLGLECLVKEGKYKLYCLSLGLAILSNYYICIMICIYLVLYFLIVLLPLAEKKVRACIHFASFSLLAGGIGAIFLIPEVLALQLSRFSSADFPSKLTEYFSLFDVLARHSFNVAIETGLDHWPNIFCSVAVFVLFPLYLVNKGIASREKIGRLALLFVMLLSFSYNMPTFIWHGMNYPDSLPCRQSFLYILLLLTVCMDAYLHLKEVSKTELAVSFSAGFVFVFLAQKLVTDDAFDAKTWLLTGIFLAIYAILLYVLHSREKVPEYLIVLFVLVMVVEAGANTLLTSLSTVSRPNYLENYETYHELYRGQAALEPDVFYRYEKTERMTNNDAMLQNYPSLSMFSSTSNGLVNHFYDRYGMRNSKVFYCSDGMTPFLSALLSQGYTFSKEVLPEDGMYELVKEQDGVYLYRNTYALPLGFTISPDETFETMLIDDKDTAFAVVAENKDDGMLPINRQNNLALRLGARGDLFTEINCEDNAGYATIPVPYSTRVYAYCDTSKHSEITAYADEEEIKTFKKLSNRYILDLGYHEAGEVLTLQSEKDEVLHVRAYSFDEEYLADLLVKLSENTLSIKEMSATGLKGSVTATEDGYLVLSVPYDPGFTVKVDGVNTEVALFEDMMLAVPLTAGEHNISLSYYPQGMTAGILICVISVLLFGIICYVERKNEHE